MNDAIDEGTIPSRGKPSENLSHNRSQCEVFSSVQRLAWRRDRIHEISLDARRF